MFGEDERYREIFEHTGTAMLVLEENMTVSMWNHKLEEVTGYTEEDALAQKKWIDVVDECDRERMAAYHENRRNGDTSIPSAYEFRFRHKDGTPRDMLVTVSLIPGTRKSLVSLIDVTERKRSEQTIRESQERFRETAELLPGVICEMDLEMNVTYVNKRGVETFGYTLEDYKRGISIADVFPPEQFKLVRQDFVNVLSGDYGNPVQYRMKRKDGSEVWVLANASPMYTRDGEVRGVRVCLIDISEQKRAQEQLRRSEERFRSVFAKSPLGMVLFAPQGTLVDYNLAFADLFGLSFENGDGPTDFSIFDYVDLSSRDLQKIQGDRVVQRKSTLDGQQDLPEGVRYLVWHVMALGPMYLAQVQDITMRKLAEERQLRRANEAARKARRLAEGLRKEIMQDAHFCSMVSRSPAMKRVFDMVPEVARSDATVLVSGESGTGKELMSRALHDLSSRKDKPFVPVNCGALPDNLLESELFGYKAGAFTDAKRDKPGRFARAEGGTIFLDEMGDISQAMQVKLLRVLQEKTYEPLGSLKSVNADVRVIAATHRDLAAMVKQGTFREDLYYRINVLTVELPPLRDRIRDIPILCDHFVSVFNARYRRDVKGVSEEALDLLLTHDYPGNVRELENILERAFVLCPEKKLGAVHVERALANVKKAESDDEEGERGSAVRFTCMEDAERYYIRQVLDETGGNRREAAKKMGMHKATLFRKLKQLGMN